MNTKINLSDLKDKVSSVTLVVIAMVLLVAILGVASYFTIDEVTQLKERIGTSVTKYDENKIFVCKNNEKTIHFVQKWIENPEDYTEQQIKFQNKEFKLLPEVLFAIIISEFKNTIEKKFLINDTIVEIPSTNHHIAERMKISLESIGLENIIINELNSFAYFMKEYNELIEFYFS